MAEQKNEQEAKVDNNKQEKLKEKVASHNQEEEIRQMTPADLRKQLSNKNADYIFRLQKELEEQGQLSVEEATGRVDALLPDLLIAQRRGQPASTYYNMSPKLKAADLLMPKKKTAADIPFWQYAVDSALLYVAIFVGIFGVIGLFQPNAKENPQMGITTLVIVGAVMGVFMTKYNEWVLPAGSKNKKIPWSKLLLGMGGMILILLACFSILSLPALRVINPILPGTVNVVIAAVAYGIRWYFRRHYEIVGSVFTPSSRSK
ncbi:DUF1129 family protein [Lactobacillus xylocopicola]|uniref:Membrane protein n=1 Tax=Lactobacillus xylocopicola TaxID=2976676 RepID=A0ABM8BFF4_9LACO|nr:DUF1129 family protein [Lactobacillus xylocopicola]BDR59958.1 membrane protein [Lactobacillus xylocopicola]